MWPSLAARSRSKSRRFVPPRYAPGWSSPRSASRAASCPARHAGSRHLVKYGIGRDGLPEVAAGVDVVDSRISSATYDFGQPWRRSYLAHQSSASPLTVSSGT